MSSKENTPPQQNKPEALVRHHILSSISTDESLQKVWQMLDQGLSSSVFSPNDSEDKGEQKSNRTATKVFSQTIYIQIHTCCVLLDLTGHLTLAIY